MLRSAFFLFFVTLNSQVFGRSVSDKLINISSELSELAKTCDNKFLISQINSKLTYCNVTAPPFNEEQISCGLFYDINRHLCTVQSKLAIDKNYTSEIVEDQTVEELCLEAKNWDVKDLNNIISNKKTIEALGNIATCIKACGYEEVMNLEANFYCKYFRWGLSILKLKVDSPVSLLHTKESSIPTGDKTAGLNNKIFSDINTVSTAVGTLTTNISHTDNRGFVGDRPVTENHAIGIVEVNAQPTTATNATENVSEINIKNQLGNKKNKVGVLEVSTAPSTNSSNGEEPPIGSQVSGNGEQGHSNLNNPNVNQNVKHDDSDKQLDDEYIASDDGSDNFQENLETDDVDKIKLTDVHKFQGPPMTFSVDSQREFYGNAQDSYEDDEDHFFSFFLTMVILIVLLYVLYHNKNKVSKVFFGLLVEGRQAGRRRNSRGHAYRRLDTLEQTMSSKSAAPPSKIIY